MSLGMIVKSGTLIIIMQELATLVFDLASELGLLLEPFMQFSQYHDKYRPIASPKGASIDCMKGFDRQVNKNLKIDCSLNVFTSDRN